MTADAFRCCVATRLAAGMALAAEHTRMGIQQNEVRQRVIESRFVESNDVDITAFMFRMAAGAVFSLRFRQPAVKTGPGYQIGADCLVTRNAKLELRLFGQRRVTGSAFCFDLRMALNNRAGHDQPLLDLCCLHGAGRCQQ